MKLAISNLAWEPAEDDAAADRMRACGYHGVELALTKYFPQPLSASAQQMADLRRAWERRGFPIVALQALLFGQADLNLFGSPAQQDSFVEYLGGIIALGGALGAHALVFGSPKNRRKGERTEEAAEREAVPVLRRLGDLAVRHGTRLCIEPNPVVYGCDFVTNTGAGLRLVKAVDHPGFGLHLDAAGATLAGETLADSIRLCGGAICHFHASAPNLGPLDEVEVAHAEAGRALTAQSYSGFVSIEQRAVQGDAEARLDSVSQSLALVARHYG